jgi:hypothetical protein
VYVQAESPVPHDGADPSLDDEAGESLDTPVVELDDDVVDDAGEAASADTPMIPGPPVVPAEITLMTSPVFQDEVGESLDIPPVKVEDNVVDGGGGAFNVETGLNFAPPAPRDGLDERVVDHLSERANTVDGKGTSVRSRLAAAAGRVTPMKVGAGLGLVAVVATGLVLWGGGGGTNRLADYQGDNDQLLYLVQAGLSDDVISLAVVEHGSDDQPNYVSYDAGSFTPARLLGYDRSTSILNTGGPVLGAASGQVVVFDPTTGGTVVLEDGADSYDVSYHPGTNSAYVVADGDTCFVGGLDEHLPRHIARGDTCSFFADGDLVLTGDDDGDGDGDGDEWSFDVVNLDGERVSSFTATDAAPMTLQRRVVASRGSSVQVIDADSGDVLIESSRSERVNSWQSNLAGDVVVVLSDDDELRVELLGAGEETPVEVFAADASNVLVEFVSESSKDVLLLADRELMLMRESEEYTPTPLGSDVVEVLMPRIGFRDGRFVAVESDGDDAVLLVGSAEAGIGAELDVPDIGRRGGEFVDGSLVMIVGSGGDEGLMTIETSGDFEMVRLFDDWDSVNRIAPVSDGFVVTGSDRGDDVIAHVMSDGRVDVFDEADEISELAVLGDTVVFSAESGGDWDVYEHKLGDRSQPVRLLSRWQLVGSGRTGVRGGELILAMSDYGAGDARDEILSQITADGTEGLDEECLKEKIDGLSDSDAQFIADNFDSEDEPEGASESALAFVSSIFDCIDFSDIDLSELDEATSDMSPRDACTAGEGAACDDLYLNGAATGDREFGGTCGRRYPTLAESPVSCAEVELN